MSYYKCFGQMDLTDRLAIETGEIVLMNTFLYCII